MDSTDHEDFEKVLNDHGYFRNDFTIEEENISTSVPTTHPHIKFIPNLRTSIRITYKKSGVTRTYTAENEITHTSDLSLRREWIKQFEQHLKENVFKK